MHPMPTLSLAAIVFTVANAAIVAGYLAVPIVVRDLPLTARAKVCGTGFFIGCAGTHAGMALAHPHMATSPTWAVWHLAQATCTWAFMLEFHRMLRKARKLRQATNAACGADLEGTPSGGRSTETR